MEDKKPRNSSLRVLAAVLVGLIGAVIIWVATPYNNYVLANSFISDSYLPVGALFLLLVLVLCINPLLRWLQPRWALDTRQLAIIVGMLLVASVIPGQGLMRNLPSMLAKAPMEVSQNKRLADAYGEMNLPPSLFPSKIGFNERVPESEYFITELPRDETIPWQAWLKPLLAWGSLLLFSWLLMIGMAMIVFPQWRRNERLPFPLVTFHQALIENPEEGNVFAGLFRKKSFWIAVGVVFLLHGLAGAKIYFPDRVPAIPLKWDLLDIFTEEPFNNFPGWMMISRIYFMFLGFAFFMPSRISFSIVFFQLAYGFYIMIGTTYMPPFEWGTIGEHRTGAMVALTFFVLWLGRAHWAAVFRTLVRRATSDEERRDRKAALMFLTGCVGMFVWLMWVGVQPGWALFLVVVTFMISLLVARFVAETGMPFFRIDAFYPHAYMRLAPFSWLGPVSVYFSAFFSILINLGSRVSAAAMATQAIGMDEEASPRHQSRFVTLLLVVLLVGLVVSGAVTLYVNYHHSMSLDGREQPLNPQGAGFIGTPHSMLLQWKEGQMSQPVYNQVFHLGFGAVLAGLLYWACLSMPRWPLHPIGLLMVVTYFSNETWISVLLGALAKVILLRFGGARLYRAAVPVFLGLIVGEVLAVAFWALVTGVVAGLGQNYKFVPIQPV